MQIYLKNKNAKALALQFVTANDTVSKKALEQVIASTKGAYTTDQLLALQEQLVALKPGDEKQAGVIKAAMAYHQVLPMIISAQSQADSMQAPEYTKIRDTAVKRGAGMVEARRLNSRTADEEAIDRVVQTFPDKSRAAVRGEIQTILNREFYRKKVDGQPIEAGEAIVNLTNMIEAKEAATMGGVKAHRLRDAVKVLQAREKIALETGREVVEPTGGDIKLNTPKFDSLAVAMSEVCHDPKNKHYFNRVKQACVEAVGASSDVAAAIQDLREKYAAEKNDTKKGYYLAGMAVLQRMSDLEAAKADGKQTIAALQPGKVHQFAIQTRDVVKGGSGDVQLAGGGESRRSNTHANATVSGSNAGTILPPVDQQVQYDLETLGLPTGKNNTRDFNLGLPAAQMDGLKGDATNQAIIDFKKKHGKEYGITAIDSSLDEKTVEAIKKVADKKRQGLATDTPGASAADATARPNEFAPMRAAVLKAVTAGITAASLDVRTVPDVRAQIEKEASAQGATADLAIAYKPGDVDAGIKKGVIEQFTSVLNQANVDAATIRSLLSDLKVENGVISGSVVKKIEISAGRKDANAVWDSIDQALKNDPAAMKAFAEGVKNNTLGTVGSPSVTPAVAQAAPKGRQS